MTHHTITQNQAKKSLFAVATAVIDAKDHLSEVDGLIGDGDHGINMAKGFRLFQERFADSPQSFADLLDELGMILLNEIGGSMGPLYGSLFIEMAETVQGCDTITATDINRMLTVATNTIADIGGATVGDKTLMDVLVPTQQAVATAVASGADLVTCLTTLKQTAVMGRDSTRDLVAKIGRASRLGERSRGVLDAGACSCCLILVTMADSFQVELS